jgi:hypothetical protein
MVESIHLAAATPYPSPLLWDGQLTLTTAAPPVPACPPHPPSDNFHRLATPPRPSAPLIETLAGSGKMKTRTRQIDRSDKIKK